MDLSDPKLIRDLVVGMITLILSIAVHEFGHAIVADKLGDRLPRYQGRVTLNPLVHADPIGTYALPIIGYVLTAASGSGARIGFGWGKPVQVNPARFTRRFEMRHGHMFVAFAGPFMNLAFGTLIAIIHVALIRFQVIDATNFDVTRVLSYAVSLNFILFFFNLVPAPPLDGGAVLEGLLPRRHLPKYHAYEPYGPFVLLAVIAIPGMSRIFTVPAMAVTGHLYKGLATLFGV